MFKTANYRQKEREAVERAHHWLEQMGLIEFANREAGNLAYGQQRRLEIARCMVLDPKLLLLADQFDIDFKSDSDLKTKKSGRIGNTSLE
jgi:ABC-type branched-subunit amino acid transport system ATPase component